MRTTPNSVVQPRHQCRRLPETFPAHCPSRTLQRPLEPLPHAAPHSRPSGPAAPPPEHRPSTAPPPEAQHPEAKLPEAASGPRSRRAAERRRPRSSNSKGNPDLGRRRPNPLRTRTLGLRERVATRPRGAAETSQRPGAGLPHAGTRRVTSGNNPGRGCRVSSRCGLSSGRGVDLGGLGGLGVDGPGLGRHLVG